MAMITAGESSPVPPPFHLLKDNLSKCGLNGIFKVEQQGKNSWEVFGTLLPQIMAQIL